MTGCAECGKEKNNKQCEYCKRIFCDDHMPQHQAWEHRHEGLAEDSARLWKRRGESR